MDVINREQAKDHQKREAFWLEKIGSRVASNIIFVCGSGHLSGHSKYRQEGFDSLLKQKGISVTVIPRLFDEAVGTEVGFMQLL